MRTEPVRWSDQWLKVERKSARELPTKTINVDAEVLARFLAKLRKGEGCWEWIACRVEDGYGQVSVGGKVLSPGDSGSDPVRMEFTWNGPRPPLKGERLTWIMNCYQHWSDRTGQRAFFIAVFDAQTNEAWRFTPHQKPVRVCRNMVRYALPRPPSLAKHTYIP